MKVGADRLQEQKVASRLRRARVGLLAHPASVTRELVHVSRVLRAMDAAPVIAFGPEHGYGGEAQDMSGVGDAEDAHGTLVRSLYGDEETALVPAPEDLARIDVLVIDLQDVGARYYTFAWTALLAVRACARAKVRVIVLDRPNPIDGVTVEGGAQRDPRCLSFVGLVPLPVRHALTLGEIVLWRAKREELDVDLTVVRCEWERSARAGAWDRPFVMPSPNMPTETTALVYPGGCLIEGTNLSEGRGTTRPFEIVGAPWIDGAKLAHDLEATGLPGFRARPLVFMPTFHKYAGAAIGGVQIHPLDPASFRPYATYLALVALARAQDPNRFAFRTERYEFRDDVPAYDLLTGDSSARRATLEGHPARDIAEERSRPSAEDLAAIEEAREVSMRGSI